MTQALLNNLINTNQVFTDKVNNSLAMQDKSFQKLLDKQSDLQDKSSVIDKNDDLFKKQKDSTIKNLRTGTISVLKEIKNPLSEFTNFLADAAKDVVDESALDLTLVKDIEEIANELEEKTNIDEISDEVMDELITDNIQNGIGVVDSVIRTVVEPIKNEEFGNIESLDNELKVTLNGKDLDSVLQDFGLNSSVEEDLLLTNPSEVDNTAETDGKTLEELVDEDKLRELNVESVEAETPDNGENSDLMKNQTPEEQGVKALLNSHTDFSDVKLDAKSEMSAQTTKPVNSGNVTPSKIIKQISKQLENLNTGSKVNIVLNPESLGKVSVQLINTKEGLSAQFTVASQDARNLIMKGLDGLKDTLASNGVSVDNVTVKLNETQESKYNADWTEQEGSRGGNKEQGSRRGQKEEKEFEQMMSFAQEEEN